jgi:hypothetical protein
MTVERFRGLVLAAALGAGLGALGGCTGVEPWDRDVLARPDMQLVTDPIEAASDEHIYFSKEASSGGQGFGGGGCGCN